MNIIHVPVTKYSTAPSKKRKKSYEYSLHNYIYSLSLPYNKLKSAPNISGRVHYNFDESC